MENKSILDGMPMSAQWQANADSAVACTLTVYSKICDKFEKDGKYGKDFVKNNQALMGQLTLAAIKDMEV